MKIFIHGISSWIGHYAVDYILKNNLDLEIHGTYRSASYLPRRETKVIPFERNLDCIAAIKEIKPELFLNLSRGETEEDFLAHQKIIETLNGLNAHYGYASSFNARDADAKRPHRESDKGVAETGYGKFKARCEGALELQSKGFAAFRFSAIHGWAPNRVARTEAFLKKLQSKEEVKINLGVIQNRLHVADLAGMMVDVLLSRGEGIFHLGTTDCSDEMDFLKRLANSFGYSSAEFIEDEDWSTNAFMVPEKILEIDSGKWRKFEDQTLQALQESEKLSIYRA